MIVEEKELSVRIEALVGEKRPFACYRLPGEENIRLLQGNIHTLRLLSGFDELNGKRGFVMAPFEVNGNFPLVLMECEEEPETVYTNWQDGGRLTGYDGDENGCKISCTKEYEACFRLFMEKLGEGVFDKLVLSRNQTVERTPGFSPVGAFRAACVRYKHSYVYLCYTPHTGLWLGSTPEILLSGERNEWHTVALAGTLPLQNGGLPHAWSEKNRKEQEYVSAYIRKQLHSLGIHSAEEGPYPVYAGALSHLKTDFRFSLHDRIRPGDLLALLHPTPAVCGLPKERAHAFILENEGYDRSYYSGFIGWMDPRGRTDLYVNLRCMHIEEENLVLYAGGGLIASSELNDEWMETEKKMQTMKRLTQ